MSPSVLNAPSYHRVEVIVERLVYRARPIPSLSEVGGGAEGKRERA